MPAILFDAFCKNLWYSNTFSKSKHFYSHYKNGKIKAYENFRTIRNIRTSNSITSKNEFFKSNRYTKRNNTVKQKYGVDNVFQLQSTKESNVTKNI